MLPSFLTNVCLLCAVSSAIFGVIGSFVVARRIGYLTGAISHAAFGGIGLSLWLKQSVAAGALGTSALLRLFCSNAESCEAARQRVSGMIEPVSSALVFAALAALLVDWIRRHAKERQETLLGAIWAIGMAVGLLALERVKGYATATTYLFGDVLLVTTVDVWTATILGALILAIVYIDFKRLETVCFDEEYAELRGINIGFQNRLLLLLTATTVVLMLRVVGMAMIVALLTLPSATAGRFAKRLSSTIVASIGICFIDSLLGVALSYRFNCATGPTIVLVAAIFYGCSLLFGRKN